jgi:general secretion pathway protein D
MTVKQASAILSVATGLALAGWVVAQDDQGFEALLNDITQPAETQPVASPTPEEAGADTSPAVADESPVAEPAAESVMEEAVPAEEAAPEADAVPAEAEYAPEAAETPAEEMVEQPAVEGESVAEGDVPAEAGETAEALAMQEEIRRQAREVQGKKSLASGLKSLEAGEYDAAIKSLEEAVQNIPARPANKKQIDQARAALGEAYYRKAAELFRKDGSLDDARANAELALQRAPDSKQASTLLRRIEAEQTRRAERALIPIPPKDRAEVKARKKTIEELITEGKGLYKIGDYDGAESAFEQVLLQDEYNVDAMRFLRKIDEVRYDIKTKEREATSAKMITQVRDAWNMPISQDVKVPPQVGERTSGALISQTERLQQKLEKIIIPSIEFRAANIQDVIAFLVDASIAQDQVDKTGVNIILNLNIPGQAAVAPSAPVDDNPFGDGGGFDALPADASANVPTITLNLRRVSLLDAIRYITEVAQLKYRLEGNAVIITPQNVVYGTVVTRFYPVQPSFLDVIIEREEAPDREGEFVEMGSGRASMKTGDVKTFFESAGVPFPAGTSITYNKSISQLIVANTPENLEKLERVLARISAVPNQVEIEARFVEIAQDDLEELGLQWILTDDWEIAQNKSSSGPLGATEQIQVNANDNGFTQGLRFFNFNRNTATIQALPSTLASTGLTPLGGIATFASVLTNPELSVVVQALSMHGGTDLLSAPRVTTRSGVNAQIQVVQEIIYPTEFETTQPQFNDTGNVTTPPVVTPGSFETRETGVILNVTPTVGPDGYTIDLTLVPEVSELVDWIQYGSTIDLANTTFTFNIPQPVFASRNVTTSIVIWDGQTVVMGGLIREELIRVSDKIPILGDIPVLGRLFRTEGQSSQKRNLLIFVTARLVDPAGKPIHREGEQPGGGESPISVDTAQAMP